MSKRRRPDSSAPAPPPSAVAAGTAPEPVIEGFTIGQTTLFGVTVARWEERLVVFLFSFLLCVFLTKTYGSVQNPGSWNDQSRMATVQALVEQGTFAIDNTYWGWWTGDKVFAGEHFYSTKPPLLSVLGAVVYWPLHHVFGLSYFNDAQAPVIYYIVTLILIGLPMSAAAVLFYDTLNWLGLRLRWRVVGVISLVVGSLYLPYSTIFQNHTVAGLAGLYSFILLWRTTCGVGPTARNLFLAGLMIALALTCDIVGGAPFALAGFVWLIVRARQGAIRTDALLLGLTGFALPVAIHFACNYAVTGDFRTIYSKAETYKLTNVKGLYGEVLERRGYFATLTDPYRWRYIINSLVGIRGIFFYSPTLLFGIWVAWQLTRRRWNGLLNMASAQQTAMSWWIGSFLGSTILTWIYLMLRTENYGGTSYGSRYFIAPMSVLLLLGVLIYGPLGSDRARGWYAEALRWSVVMAAVGIAFPWGVLGSDPRYYTNFSFVANAQNYAQFLLTTLLGKAGYLG
ncbi:MAG: hypothetical protein ABI743_03675 [bacterium]